MSLVSYISFQHLMPDPVGFPAGEFIPKQSLPSAEGTVR